jgi:hypothetical protein
MYGDTNLVKIRICLVEVQASFVLWHLREFVRDKNSTEYRSVDENE